MPYAIRKTAPGEFKLVNRETGRVMGTHTSKTKADSQRRAIYANTEE